MYFWQNIVALSHLLFVGIHRVCVFVSSSIGVIVDACRGVYAWSEGTTWSYDLHFVFLFLLTSYTDRSRIFFFFKSDFFPLSSLLTLFSFEPRMHVHSSHIFTLNSGNRVLFHTHSFSICVLVHTASYSVHYFPIVSLLRLFLLMLVMDCSVGNMRQGKFICVANVYIRTMEFSVLYTDITFWS